jgi:two-component system, OmpR family, response regulator RegX3
LTKILIAEDEPAILDAVSYTLRGEGFDVDVVADGESALEAARGRAYDLMILDLMLPKLSGTEVCRRVRSESALPIIMLTAKSAMSDRVLGLEIGADDYVTKPFAMDELVGRVRALLRRRELDRQGPTGGLRAGGLEIDAYRHRVVVDGEQRPLTPSECSRGARSCSTSGTVATSATSAHATSTSRTCAPSSEPIGSKPFAASATACSLCEQRQTELQRNP